MRTMTLVLTAISPPYNYRKGKLAAAAYPKFIAAVIIAYELASTRDGGAQLLVLKPDGLSALRRLLDGWGGQGDLGRRLGRELRLPSPMTATDRHVLDVYPACGLCVLGVCAMECAQYGSVVACATVVLLYPVDVLNAHTAHSRYS
jgi:hypothetical protein